MFGGLLAVSIATQYIWSWTRRRLVFGEPLRIMPTRFGVPFKWVGVSRNPLFYDKCQPRLTHPGDELLALESQVP